MAKYILELLGNTKLYRCFIAGVFRAFNILMLLWKSLKGSYRMKHFHDYVTVIFFFPL